MTAPHFFASIRALSRTATLLIAGHFVVAIHDLTFYFDHV